MKAYLAGAVSVALMSLGTGSRQEQQPLTPEEVCTSTRPFAGPCETVHGRLGLSNGPPTMILWKIGTTRRLGVLEVGNYPGTCYIPANVSELLLKDKLIYADFVVRPSTPSRPGIMQMVCLVAATHIVTRPAYFLQLPPGASGPSRGRHQGPE
jgi:hypothetical protein